MAMASLPWLPVIGWLVSPIISIVVNKLLSNLDFHLSRKLQELKYQIIPSLEEILGDVTEQRMLRAAKGEGKGSESDLKKLGELEMELKFELYDIVDVMDLIEYRRIEKKLIVGDGKLVGTSISSWVLQAIGDCIASCKRSSFRQKLWQCTQTQNQKLSDLGAKLQQCAQYLNQMFRELPQSLPLYIHQGAAGQPSMPDAPTSRSAPEFRDGIEQGSAKTASTQNPMTPNALPDSAVSVTEFRGDNQQRSAEEAPSNSLVQMICDWLVYGFSALRSFYLAARRLRDWSYQPFHIKNDDGSAIDCVVSVTEMISLRKKMKNIEHIVAESKKSPLLNKSSNSTPKDADKESSSNCAVKNSAEESTSTQKEIDDVYRSIEKKVFGRDKDRELVSRMLRDGPDADAASSSTSKPYSVIGIYGITGSGKSTLAQYVCDHEKVAGHFNPIMFIQVGKTFSVSGIFRDMLKQIKPSQTSDKDLKSLKTELKEELKGKCFLLVLDDLWVNGNNMKERLILLDVLDAGQSGSRILVTAQKKDAAAALGAEERMQIPIPDLEDEQYLSMFMYYALEVNRVTSTDYGRYKAIGSKITKKLRRSPIAAITVAARLKSDNSIDFWERTSILDVLNETMGALWWSYQQLGIDIRRCFAYCSIFPRAYRLERDELVRIWIAQGFVNTMSNATGELEDIGQSYCDELLKFSFLQVQRKIFNRKTEALTIHDLLNDLAARVKDVLRGLHQQLLKFSFLQGQNPYSRMEVVEFTIHDLLHELTERVSGSEFYRIGLNGLPTDIPRGVHHLSIQTNNVAGIVEKILDMGNLRSLIISEEHYAYGVDKMGNHDLENVLGRLFMRLRKLRVLILKLNYSLSSEMSVSVPLSIYLMKHLRYLCSDLHVGRLIFPSTFSKLYHIQVIDIRSSPTSYPEDMANLICLRHIPRYLSCPTLNIGRLTSLQELNRFEVKEGQGHGLKQLKHLNKLGGFLWIKNLGIVGSKVEALEAHITHKERLSRLLLEFGEKRVDPDVEAEVLEGLCPPKDLQELLIDGYRGSRYPSWMLSRHHSETAPKHLQELVLLSCSQLAAIPDDSELFTGLRKLHIFDCDWDRLPENMERLLSLQTLEISFCDKIEFLPTLPGQSLQKIIIKCCAVLSAMCKEEGHENWHKIQQIPKKVIDGQILRSHCSLYQEQLS